MVRDSLIRDELAGGGVAVERVPQLGVGALRGVDGHTGGVLPVVQKYSSRGLMLGMKCVVASG